MADHIVRIGGASGAWGDSPRAIPQLLRSNVNYLMMDYLAEVTMSLLARAKMREPAGGFPPDFVGYLKDALPEIARRGIKVMSNAGGVNPKGCKAALEALCREAGVALRIAAVEGDDLLPLIDELRALPVREAVSGAALPRQLLTANAYLGALPIKAAFDAGADIVITGRCADSALALGALMHEFKWSADDFDRLAAGSLVGHLLECGPQATGGNFTDWDKVPDWANIGYPIAECHADGSFVLTKPDHTGGMVTPATVSEQLLYEIGDPSSYILPDLVADFSQVHLTQLGPDRVLVTGARGRPPTDTYKVSATYQDGYRAVATVSIVGPNAAAKAIRTGEEIIARARLDFRTRDFADFSATYIEALGAEAAYGPAARGQASREVLLRLVVVHHDRRALDLFAREIGSIGLSCAPGTTGIYGGRPKPSPVVRLYTFYIPKTKLADPLVQLGEEAPFAVSIPAGGPFVEAVAPAPIPPATEIAGPMVEVPLLRLALARSGDKGNSANIAIIARDPAYLPVLRQVVTPERMAEHFAGLVAGPVQRFEAPGISALNFLLQDALGGGGMASLRIDPQGKAFGQMALEMLVSVPQALLP